MSLSTSGKVPRPVWRRRQIIVSPMFQLKYSIFLALLGGTTSVLFGAIMSAARLEAVNSEAGLEFAERAGPTPGVIVVLAGIMVVGSFLLLGVAFTHRIAGPAMLLERYIKALGEGSLPFIRPLRARDELTEVVDELRKTVDFLREQDRSESEALRSTVDALVPAAQGDEKVRKALEALQALQKQKQERCAGELGA